MKEGHLLMSKKERHRSEVVSQVCRGQLTSRAGSEALKVSPRQFKRLLRRYKDSGDSGLVHKHRGHPSGRRTDETVKARVLDLYQSQYPDFGPTLASEKLLERDNVTVNHETLRLWLIEAGLWKSRRKKPQHLKWRERKGHFGEMLQLDGSDHHWFEDRGARCFLMNMVDDATGTTHSLMSHEETTVSAMVLLEQWIRLYGVPRALYVDLRNVYVTGREPTIAEQLAGEPALTQFGRACHKLNIRIIKAHSPQAKGRVERSNGVQQDRTIKELRLYGISDIPAANVFLPGYLAKHNQKFAVLPRDPIDYHTPLDRALDLRTVFCLEEKRVVSNDYTISYNTRKLQILRQQNLPPVKSKIIVQEWQDGSLHLLWHGKDVAATDITDKIARPQAVAARPASAGGQAPVSQANSLSKGDAWKRPTSTSLILGEQVFGGLVEQHTASLEQTIRTLTNEA
jgi:hypothetical protein